MEWFFFLKDYDVELENFSKNFIAKERRRIFDGIPKLSVSFYFESMDSLSS